jgi:hypothetical protein
MNIQNIKRRASLRKNRVMNIRISEHLSKWMREKDYSPTAIFYEAVKDLGYKEE